MNTKFTKCISCGCEICKESAIRSHNETLCLICANEMLNELVNSNPDTGDKWADICHLEEMIIKAA